MVLEYKREATVREISRKREKETREKSQNFIPCGELQNIPIKNIFTNPYQPRKEFDQSALQDLAVSIMEYGLMQPITVRQISPFDYQLIAGERRLAACQKLGKTYIPAVVMTASSTDSAVLALVENIQRENLSYMEEAEAFAGLMEEHGMTQEELADKLGKSQSTIANKVRILKLTPPVRRMLEEHHLSERHARALLRLPEEKQQLRTLRLVVERGLNVAKTEELVEKFLKSPAKAAIKARPDGERIFKDVRIFQNTIRQAVDMMRRAGISAKTDKTENENYIEYTILIPKE